MLQSLYIVVTISAVSVLVVIFILLAGIIGVLLVVVSRKKRELSHAL